MLKQGKWYYRRQRMADTIEVKIRMACSVLLNEIGTYHVWHQAGELFLRMNEEIYGVRRHV